ACSHHRHEQGALSLGGSPDGAQGDLIATTWAVVGPDVVFVAVLALTGPAVATTASSAKQLSKSYRAVMPGPAVQVPNWKLTNVATTRSFAKLVVIALVAGWLVVPASRPALTSIGADGFTFVYASRPMSV